MKVTQIDKNSHDVLRVAPNDFNVSPNLTEQERLYWKHRLHAGFYNPTASEQGTRTQWYINKYHKFYLTKTNWNTYSLLKTSINEFGYDVWIHNDEYYMLTKIELPNSGDIIFLKIKER